jgi:hypothetical protein
MDDYRHQIAFLDEQRRESRLLRVDSWNLCVTIFAQAFEPRAKSAFAIPKCRKQTQ